MKGSVVSAEVRFAAAMGGRTFNGRGPTAASPPRTLSKPTSLPVPDGLLLGDLETGGGIAVDLTRLLEGRLLIQGVSGAGKSWALRRLMEQAYGQVQLIVVDPEGEFGTLATELQILHVAGHKLDMASLRQLALRCREHRQSLVLDLSECDRTGQMIAIAPFLEGLVEAPRDHWHACLVVIDEAHLFAPFGGHSTAETSVRKAAIGAVVDVMGRGRKRGLAGVLATQRLARLAKSVTSEVSNHLVGLNTQDLDIKRAAEQIGWDARKAFDRLPMLQPGEFVAAGRAFSTQPAQVKVGSIRSEHKGAAPPMAAPPSTSAAGARDLLGLDELLAQSEADLAQTEEAQSATTRAVREFIRDASFVIAARIVGALIEVRPDGVTHGNLAEHLGVTSAEVVQALALLDVAGVVEHGVDDVVALDRGFAKTLGGAS